MHFAGGGRGRGEGVGVAVEKRRVDARIHRADDVGRKVVANHQRAGAVGSRLCERKIKKLRSGLVGSRLVAQHHRVETAVHARRFDFSILHFGKTIAAKMQPVAARTEMVEQFVRSLHHPGLGAAEFEKRVAQLQAVVSRGVASVARGERPAEAFDDQGVAIDFTVRVLHPKCFVGAPIGARKRFERGEVLRQIVVVVEFAQGQRRIAVRVIERVVEVDEQIGIGKRRGHGETEVVCGGGEEGRLKRGICGEAVWASFRFQSKSKR